MRDIVARLMPKWWHRVRSAGFGLLLVLPFPGCIALPSFSDLNQLPGFKETPTKEGLFYDNTIQAYRIKEADDSKGLVLRNAVGKKIQTEQELDRFAGHSKRKIVGSGTRYTAYALATVYAPINVAAQLFYIVPAIAIMMTAPTVNAAYRNAAEAAYRSGREHFSRHEFDEALADWDRAKSVMPDLQWTSDVEYWRGRVLQECGIGAEALIAYQLFSKLFREDTAGLLHERFR